MIVQILVAGETLEAEVVLLAPLFVDLKHPNWKTYGQIRRFWLTTGVSIDPAYTNHRINSSDLSQLRSMSQTIPRKRNKERVRERGRRQLGSVLARGGGVCHWCRKPLVHLASLDPASITSKTNKSVWWIGPDGKKQFSLIATVDHVVAVADGGKNGRNIVPACRPCNQARKSCIQKTLDAEHSRAREEERMMIRWLRKVEAKVEFGELNTIRVVREVENQQVVVAEAAHRDFVHAFARAKEQYEKWYTATNGFTGRVPGPQGLESARKPDGAS